MHSDGNNKQVYRIFKIVAIYINVFLQDKTIFVTTFVFKTKYYIFLELNKILLMISFPKY